jgi:TolA-binding protein
MSPKAVQYKANSIIYFKGDTSERVYILKSGKVSLKSNDIETGQEMQEMIQMGEFFGVKSALGKYPREETAIVLTPSLVIAFTVPEFEQLVMKNTRIIMKMLKVFSNQLRRIHNKVQNLISTEEQGIDPETGLFQTGEYFLKAKKYTQAVYALRRYLTYYPSGKYANQVTSYLDQAESRAQNQPSEPAEVSGSSAVSSDTSSSGGQLSDVAKKYYNGVSLFSQQKYKEALKEFDQIVSQGSDEEYKAKSLFEIGRCLYSLGEYDKCIKHFTGMIQQYPKHPELMDALFYVGSSYERKENNERAVGFYKKILSMTGEDSTVHNKAKKAIRKLEGK